MSTIVSNGGGASHIAKVTGQLKDLSSNLSDILMVSGGGGGGLILNDIVYDGAEAGGISGSGSLSGNQSSGYQFGQGENGANGGEPTPDPEYASLVSQLSAYNKLGKEFVNGRPYILWRSYTGIWVRPKANQSIIGLGSNGYFVNDYDSWLTANEPTIAYYKVFDVYVNSNGQGQYVVSTSTLTPGSLDNNDESLNGKFGVKMMYKSGSNVLNYDWLDSSGIHLGFPFTFSSLSTAINFIVNNMRNVNLYVDGVPWYLAETSAPITSGGAGLYGGFKSETSGGGAGSGYIGNSLLSNKKMVGYNIPTSSAEGTKTESVNEVSASAVSGKPKSGNGFARIKLLSEGKNVTYKSIAKTSDMAHYVTGGDGSNGNIQSAFLSYKNTDYILWSAISSSVYSRERPFDYNNSTGIFAFNSANYATAGFYGYVLFPFIPKIKILKVSFKVRIQANSNVDFGVRLRDADLNSSTMLTMFLADPATQMDWTTVEYNVPDAYRNTEYGWLQMHFQVKAEVKDIVFTYLE